MNRKVIGINLSESDEIRFTWAAGDMPLVKWFRYLAEKEYAEESHRRNQNRMGYHASQVEGEKEMRIKGL